MCQCLWKRNISCRCVSEELVVLGITSWWVLLTGLLIMQECSCKTKNVLNLNMPTCSCIFSCIAGNYGQSNRHKSHCQYMLLCEAALGQQVARSSGSYRYNPYTRDHSQVINSLHKWKETLMLTQKIFKLCIYKKSFWFKDWKWWKNSFAKWRLVVGSWR